MTHQAYCDHCGGIEQCSFDHDTLKCNRCKSAIQFHAHRSVSQAQRAQEFHTRREATADARAKLASKCNEERFSAQNHLHDEFEHFLSYTGFRSQPDNVVKMLRTAYFHGAEGVS